MVAVPIFRNVSTPPSMVQTSGVSLTKVTESPELAVAVRVGVVPKS